MSNTPDTKPSEIAWNWLCSPRFDGSAEKAMFDIRARSTEMEQELADVRAEVARLRAGELV